MFIAGMAMIIMGLRLSGYLPILRRIRLPSCLAKHSAFHGKADRRKGAVSSLIVGLLNGFMPCGPLQAMQLYALSSGSAAEGALSMFLFSSGTVPVMLLAGILGGRLNRRHAGKIIQVSAPFITTSSQMPDRTWAPGAHENSVQVNNNIFLKKLQMQRKKIPPQDMIKIQKAGSLSETGQKGE